MKIKNISIFLIAIYLSLDFIIPEFYEKDIVEFCSERGKYNQFLSNSKFRSCIVNRNFRGDLIDELILKQRSTSGLSIKYWKEKFDKNNDLFIKNAKSIGLDKFEEIDYPLYGRSIVEFNYNHELPTLVKVRMDCSIFFNSCKNQYIGKAKLDGFWDIEFDNFIDIHLGLHSITTSNLPVDLYLMTASAPNDILEQYKINLIGFNILDLESAIEQIRMHSNRMSEYYNKFR